MDISAAKVRAAPVAVDGAAQCRFCDAKAIALGLCRRHYSQQRRHGTAEEDASPEIGSPSGHGQWGIIDRDETSIGCHECGARVVRLGAHLGVHGMSVAEYRVAHGLPRSVGLVSLGEARLMSERALARVGSPGWQRLEAARDPQMAAASRDAAALRAPAVVRHAAAQATKMAAESRGSGRVKECPVCGAGFRGRNRTCGAGCAAVWRRRDRAPRIPKAEVAALRADPSRLVPVWLDQGFSRVRIAEALGVDPTWVYRRWPVKLSE